MKEYLKPELLIDLFLQADVMTESTGGDNDFENPWVIGELDIPTV